MPRTPEVCSCAFCPPRYATKDGAPVLTSHGPAFVLRLVTGAFCLLLFIACHSLVNAVYAQGSTATLSGTVTDQNDAVVPGVNVAVISITQGFQRSTITNGEGTYIVPLLPPGTYTVKAEREGFTTAEVRDVVLNVNDQVTLNIPLKVGSLGSQSIDVVATPSLLDQSPAVGTTIDHQFVSNLPLNGRSFQSLITLSPGVVLTKTSVVDQGQFSVNGQRANANYVTVDGVSANIGIVPGGNVGQSSSGALPGFSVSGGTSNLVSVDAVEEFKILTSTFAPEFGRTPGAQVTIASRSGTNQFNGNLFEYFRNDVLDATDWFVNANPALKKGALRQNNFGAVLGGPLLLPSFGEGTRPIWYDGRNRTFFFFSYEGLRLRLPLFAATDVPSRAARQMAPAAIKPILNAYPLPTGPDRINGLADFVVSYSDPSTLNATSLRMDHVVGNKLTLFGRFNYSPSELRQRGSNLAPLNNINTVRIKTLTLTTGATYIASPTITADLRLNYSRNQALSSTAADELGGAVPPPDSLLFPAPYSSRDSQVFFLVATGGRNTVYQPGQNADNLQRQQNLVGHLSVVSGNHQFKMGADYRRLMPLWRSRLYSQTLQFSGVLSATGTAAPGTAVSSIAQAAVVAATETNSALFENISTYFQDTWKLSRRLTLTYGVRWDINPPPEGQKDLISGTGDSPATFAIAPPGTPLYATTYGNFGPRIGVAYHLRQQSDSATVLRGGWGIFYDLGAGFIGNAFNSFPYSRSRVTTLTPYPLSTAVATPPPFSIDQPFTSTIFVADPHLQLPHTYQWNLTADQSLGTNQVVSVAYVGAKGRELLRLERYANPNPKFVFVDVTKNTASSDYNSLQFQFRRRLSRGLQALVSYTWSESLDNVSADSVFLSPNDKLDPQIDRGSSDFDIRHQFSAAVTYNIPSPGFGRVGRGLLKNWAIDSIFAGRSGGPVNIVYSRNIGFGNFTSFRPDLVDGIPLYIEDPKAPGGRRFNNQVVVIPGNPRPQVGPFRPPVENRQGNLPRNFLRGFPVYQLDLAFRRDFQLKDRLRLQFRTEVFNLFNHPNFADPNGTLLTGNNANTAFGLSPSMFGRSLGSGGSAGGFNPLYQIGGPRSIQLALKLMF